MSNSFYPPQIGFIPSGNNQDSRVIIGRNPNVGWDAIGFGQYGRPDTLQQFELFITASSGDQLGYQTTPLAATVLIDARSMFSVISTNPLAPQTGFFFSMREVSVCELDNSTPPVSTERKMMILASQTYPTGSG